MSGASKPGFPDRIFSSISSWRRLAVSWGWEVAPFLRPFGLFFLANLFMLLLPPFPDGLLAVPIEYKD